MTHESIYLFFKAKWVGSLLLMGASTGLLCQGHSILSSASIALSAFTKQVSVVTLRRYWYCWSAHVNSTVQFQYLFLFHETMKRLMELHLHPHEHADSPGPFTFHVLASPFPTSPFLIERMVCSHCYQWINWLDHTMGSTWECHGTNTSM